MQGWQSIANLCSTGIALANPCENSKVDAHKEGFTQRRKGGKDAKKLLLQNGFIAEKSHIFASLLPLRLCVKPPFVSVSVQVFTGPGLTKILEPNTQTIDGTWWERERKSE